MITDEPEPRFFIHAHAAFDARCYFGARRPNGEYFLTHNVLYAEAVKLEDAQRIGLQLAARYPLVVNIDAQPCISEEIIPAHMRIWEK